MRNVKEGRRIQQELIRQAGRLSVIKITITELGHANTWYKLERQPGLPFRRCETRKEALQLFEKLKAAAEAAGPKRKMKKDQN